MRVTKTKHFFIIPDFLSPIWCTNNFAVRGIAYITQKRSVVFLIARVGRYLSSRYCSTYREFRLYAVYIGVWLLCAGFVCKLHGLTKNM